MSEQSVKVGDIVFAADLVKVQKGTLYYTITYYDLSSLNLSLKIRAHRAFELLSTDYSGFQYWNINDVSVKNNALIEEGLTADTSAYMRADSTFNITYYNYGQCPTYITTPTDTFLYLFENDMYLSNVNGQVTLLRTDVTCEIASNIFELSTYRFTGWKKDDYGEMILPYTLVLLQNDTSYYAQWIKQYWFKFGNIPANGKTILLDREYKAVGKINYYDISSILRLSACPDEHYHFEQFNCQYVDENGNTPPITSFTIDKLTDNTLSLILSNNIKVASTYAIDTYKLSFNTYSPNIGTVIVLIGSDTYTNGTTVFTTLEKPWNTKLYFSADTTSRLSTFLRWEGNVPAEFEHLSQFITNLVNDLSATAMYMPNSVYSVLVYTNNPKFGTASTNRDPETPQLPKGTYVQPSAGKTFNVVVTAKPKDNCQFICMKDSFGKIYNTMDAILTNNITCSYQVTAYFDTELVDDSFEPIIDELDFNIDDTYTTSTADIIKDTSHLERCYEYPDELLSSNTLIIMQNHIANGDADTFKHTCNEIIPAVRYMDITGTVIELYKDKNYILTYENNIVDWKDIGKGEIRTQTAYVVIEGIGIYSGQLKLEFIILYTRNNDEPEPTTKTYNITLNPDGGKI